MKANRYAPVLALILTSIAPMAEAGRFESWQRCLAVWQSPLPAPKTSLVIGRDRLHIRDPRDIVSFGLGTREEYDNQVAVAKSLVGKDISTFFTNGPEYGTEAVRIRELESIPEWGSDTWKYRGISLRFEYGQHKNMSSSESLWNILAFANYIENWKAPVNSLQKANAVIAEGSYPLTDIIDIDRARLVLAAQAISVVKPIDLRPSEDLSYWADRLRAEVLAVDIFSFFGGQYLKKAEQFTNSSGRPVVAISRELAEGTEALKYVQLELEYWIRRKISKEYGYPGINPNGLIRYMPVAGKEGYNISEFLNIPKGPGPHQIRAGDFQNPLRSFFFKTLDQRSGYLFYESKSGANGGRPVLEVGNGGKRLEITVFENTTMRDFLMTWAELLVTP